MVLMFCTIMHACVATQVDYTALRSALLAEADDVLPESSQAGIYSVLQEDDDMELMEWGFTEPIHSPPGGNVIGHGAPCEVAATFTDSAMSRPSKPLFEIVRDNLAAWRAINASPFIIDWI